MSYLVDTNVILRWAHAWHPEYDVAVGAVEALRDQAEDLYVTAQNLIEFWNVATRPLNRNGFGLTAVQAEQEVARLETYFLFAADDPAIYREWRQLVSTVGVSGTQVHDARLAATARVYGLTHILTFNTADFNRYPGLTAVHPHSV